MGKMNICPRCDGPLRTDGKCIQPQCREAAERETPVVEMYDPEELSKQASVRPAEATGRCPVCEKPLGQDGECLNGTCRAMLAAMQMADQADGYSEPPDSLHPKLCIPPLTSEQPGSKDEGWQDGGRCPRCRKVLEDKFTFCPKCGFARQRRVDPYAVVQSGIPPPLPPTTSGFQPTKKPEYSFIDPTFRKSGKGR